MVRGEGPEGLLRYIDGTRYVPLPDPHTPHGPLRDCSCCAPEDHQWAMVYSHMRPVGGQTDVDVCLRCSAHRVRIYARREGDAPRALDREYYLCRDGIAAASRKAQAGGAM